MTASFWLLPPTGDLDISLSLCGVADCDLSEDWTLVTHRLVGEVPIHCNSVKLCYVGLFLETDYISILIFPLNSLHVEIMLMTIEVGKIFLKFDYQLVYHGQVIVLLSKGKTYAPRNIPPWFV